MSWKSIACVAAIGALTAPALAVPTIQVVKNTATTGSLFVTTTATGSIGTELTLTLSGATLGGATINSSVFDTANPGDVPWQAGSPVGGDGSGLVLDLANNRLFAAFGSLSVGAGQHKLLDFTFSGATAGATATGDGFVGSIGVLTDVPAAVTSIAPPAGILGDTNGDGLVNAVDFNNVRNNFGLTSPPAVGNADGVAGPVNAGDFNAVRNNFGQTNPLPSTAVSIPEPATLAACMVGLVAVAARRR